MFGSTVRGVGVMEASGEGRVIVIRSIPVFKVLIMRGGLDSTSLARPPFIEAPVQSRENYRSFMHMCVCVCVCRFVPLSVIFRLDLEQWYIWFFILSLNFL